jgi:hypothetical protein
LLDILVDIDRNRNHNHHKHGSCSSKNNDNKHATNANANTNTKKKKFANNYDPNQIWKAIENKNKNSDNSNNNNEYSSRPSMFISPMRFILGAGILQDLVHYLSIVLPDCHRPAIIITQTSLQRLQSNYWTAENLNAISEMCSFLIFEGACLFKGADQILNSYYQQLEKQQQSQTQSHKIDCIVSIGGGKIIDVGKLVG